MASLLNMSGGSLLKKGLPYDYEVEYLESTGTQWIDTEVIAQNGLNINCDFLCTKRDNGILYGYRYYIEGGAIWCKSIAATAGGRVIFIYDTNRTYFVSPCDINVWYNIKSVDNKLYIDNTLFATAGNTHTFTGRSIYLFGQHSGQGEDEDPEGRGASLFSYFRIKRFSIDGYRDFIPVVKDNVGYMYDKVSKQLFGNSGTGSFIVGPRVS